MKRFGQQIGMTLAMLAVAACGPAAACTVMTQPQLESAAEADLVFVGRFESFRVFQWAANYPGVSLPFGQYTFSVIETLKGDAQQEWEILWWVNIIGTNTKVDPEKTVIVTAYEDSEAIHSLAEVTAVGGSFLDLSHYIIREPACSSAPIFENTPENRAAIEAVLASTRVVTQ